MSEPRSRDGRGRQRVDLIVAGEIVVTSDEARPTIERGAVAVADGRIIAVDSETEIAAAYDAEVALPGEGMVLMPGLINGHSHVPMVLFRGLADDLTLEDWLTHFIFPAEVELVDDDFVQVGESLGCWEMIKGGTTTFLDMYYRPDTAASVVTAAGLRAVIAPALFDTPSPGHGGWDDAFAAAVDFITRWRGRPRIVPAVAPHALYTVGPDNLPAAMAAARELDVPLTTHLAETWTEVETIRERYGVRPVQHLEDLGLLDPRLIAAHVVWADEAEVNLLAQRGVGVIHNPTSNLKLASGVAPIPAMLRAGVKVGLGTDGAASNNNLDMWREMHLAALIHKGVSLDPMVVPARTAVHMATLGGAQALGLGDQIGALTVGRRADLIQVRLTEPHLIPRYDIFSHLVYAARADDVDTVVVDGQIVMHGRRVLTLDEAAIRAGVARISNRVRELRLGVEPGMAVQPAGRTSAMAACPSCGAPLLVARS